MIHGQTIHPVRCKFSWWFDFVPTDVDSTDKVSIRTDDCRSSVGDVDIHVNGILSFVVNWLTPLIEKPLEARIPDFLCNLAKKEVSALSQTLQRSIREERSSERAVREWRDGSNAAIYPQRAERGLEQLVRKRQEAE